MRSAPPIRSSHRARPKVVVLGSMCRLPVAGVAYQILHYMIGLKRLGFDPYFIEWHGNWVEDPAPSAPVRRVDIAAVMRRFGFGERWACQADQIAPGATFGPLAADAVKRLYAEAVALFNVTGAHFIDDDMRQCPRRLYVETDPGIPQIRAASGDPAMLQLLAGHTHFCTFGENLASANCLLPSSTVPYRTTRQPVVLDMWASAQRRERDTFTTVARWRKAKDKAIAFRGERYRWNKDLEFEPFLDLPTRSSCSFELALADIEPAEQRRLQEGGWGIADAVSISASLDAYRGYIAASAGEFTIAKDQYVRLRTGWFSDRSACYLASGRPVITQDTGSPLPTGEGLFAFATIDDALTALEAVASDYARHARAAREIAHEYFDADRVLTQLLACMEVEVPASVVHA